MIARLPGLRPNAAFHRLAFLPQSLQPPNRENSSSSVQPRANRACGGMKKHDDDSSIGILELPKVRKRRLHRSETEELEQLEETHFSWPPGQAPEEKPRRKEPLGRRWGSRVRTGRYPGRRTSRAAFWN